VERDETLILNSLTYPVYIGNSLWKPLGDFIKPYFTSGGVYILTDHNTHKSCFPVIAVNIEALAGVPVFSIIPGEQSKETSSVEMIWNWLMEEGAGKNSLLINLGGGVVSDLGGFAAATYKRGMPFINLPTSLIGQADAAIGGKTGINFSGIKNQAGVFANPEAVFINPGFLGTLPADHIRSGFAEIIKSAILSGNSFWDHVRNTSPYLDGALNDMIINSVEFKISVVASDPYENSFRKVLNFGHTIGHAIEALYNRNGMPGLFHGDAVAAGMVCEAFISNEVAGLSKMEFNDIVAVITKHFQIKTVDDQNVEELLLMMGHDKKRIGNDFSFSLINAIGNPVFDVKVDKQVIFNSFRYINQIKKL
jgi:3-dehydroquinate synthase